MAVRLSAMSKDSEVSKSAPGSAADNECAEALLQLAMSISPLERHEYEDRRPSLSSFSSTSPKSLVDRRPSVTSISSCVKDERGSSVDYGSGFTEDQETDNPLDQLMDKIRFDQNQLVDKIHLDHNYYWPGDEKKNPTNINGLYHGDTADSLLEEILGDDVGIPPRWNKENSLDKPIKSKRSPGKRFSPYSGRKIYGVPPADRHSFVDYPHRPSASSAENNSERKYSKLQLLMKCLIANNPEGEVSKAHDSVTTTVMSTNGMEKLESDDDENDSGHFVDVESDLEGDSHYVCPECPKTFSKRRYLTKHVHRMHPEADFPDMRDEIATACPNCFRVIQRRNFRRHLMVCDVEMSRMKNKHYTDSDLAFCQFCGIQMKRHLLVKHLAKEHCIDRHTIQFDQEFSKFLADDEDTSMYPSDTSYPMQENNATYTASQNVVVDKSKVLDISSLIKPCPKCGISVSGDLLARHMALDHEIVVDNTSALAASKCSCKHSMLQAYLNGTTEENASGTAGSSHPCDACVQNLSTLSEHCSASVLARSSERVALSSPLSGMSSLSPGKSTRGSSSTISAEETRIQVSLLEDTAHTLLQCAAAPVANI